MTQSITAEQLRAMGGLEGLHRKGLEAVPAIVPDKTGPKQAQPGLARRAPHQVGRMNKTEAKYYAHLLQRQAVGEILAILYEGIKLKIADKTFYTPDFVVVTPHGVELHEVKGFWEDDARVKWKATAEAFWWFTFKAVTKGKGGWTIETYGGC